MKLLLILFLFNIAISTKQVKDYYQNLYMKRAKVWPQTYRKAYFSCINEAKMKYQGQPIDTEGYVNAKTNCESQYYHSMTGNGII